MSTVETMPSLISVQEAAEIIGCTTGRIRQMLRADKSGGEKLNERAWAVRRKWAERHAKKAPTGRPRSNDAA